MGKNGVKHSSAIDDDWVPWRSGWRAVVPFADALTSAYESARDCQYMLTEKLARLLGEDVRHGDSSAPLGPRVFENDAPPIANVEGNEGDGHEESYYPIGDVFRKALYLLYDDLAENQIPIDQKGKKYVVPMGVLERGIAIHGSSGQCFWHSEGTMHAVNETAQNADESLPKAPAHITPERVREAARFHCYLLMAGFSIRKATRKPSRRLRRKMEEARRILRRTERVYRACRTYQSTATRVSVWTTGAERREEKVSARFWFERPKRIREEVTSISVSDDREEHIQCICVEGSDVRAWIGGRGCLREKISSDQLSKAGLIMTHHKIWDLINASRFKILRSGLDGEGDIVERIPDGEIDGRPCCRIRVEDKPICLEVVTSKEQVARCADTNWRMISEDEIWIEKDSDLIRRIVHRNEECLPPNVFEGIMSEGSSDSDWNICIPQEAPHGSIYESTINIEPEVNAPISDDIFARSEVLA